MIGPELGILQAEIVEGAPAWLGAARAAIAAVLILVGSAFLAAGTVGLLRLPNVYNRLHATSKATTAGAASVFLAGFVYFGPEGTGLVSLVGIVFLFLTAPTGAHMISRAAGKMGVNFEPGTTWPAPEDGAEDTEVSPDGGETSGDDTAADGDGNG